MGVLKNTETAGNSTGLTQAKSTEPLDPVNRDEHAEKNFKLSGTCVGYLALLCFLLATVTLLQTCYVLQITMVFKSQAATKDAGFKDLMVKYQVLNNSYATLFRKYPALNQYCTVTNGSVHECKPCPAGWELFGEKCYFFSSDRRDWLSSWYLCLSQGGHLATVKNKEEQKFLWDEAQRLSQGDSYWLGLANVNPDKVWRWVDDSAMEDSIQFWDEPPQTEDSRELCARLTARADPKTSWYFITCKNVLKRICERRQGSPLL
ncbi:C-type lectin domain family 4 member E-like [Chanos chanos]|uniref:C-type lectin domain family 4 member E-like n=1 Tax=Chanos chanos TaxID=29144 RepID=A0A6J2WMA3_CHACN|nr:C-type lectin domain family 4 member E-like [Chanos chanos]